MVKALRLNVGDEVMVSSTSLMGNVAWVHGKIVGFTNNPTSYFVEVPNRYNSSKRQTVIYPDDARRVKSVENYESWRKSIRERATAASEARADSRTAVVQAYRNRLAEKVVAELRQNGIYLPEKSESEVGVVDIVVKALNGVRPSW